VFGDGDPLTAHATHPRWPRARLSRRALLSLGTAFALAPRAALADMPVIAAASDLQFALPAVAERFTAETGRQVRIAFGSSGNFRRQIAQGGPFEMYVSADESYVLALHEEGWTEDEGTLYAIGRIVMMVPHGSPLAPDGGLGTLREALAEGALTRFAIANPDHAPYGVAAMEALRATGLWDDIRPFLVQGENVSQAAQFALSGNAEGGIVAYSLALAPAVSARGAFELIPERLHAPLRQRMALVRGAGETARAFYDHLRGAAAREILIRYGFVLPGEDP
jgi:molybdate transport system substrate-binding protein